MSAVHLTGPRTTRRQPPGMLVKECLGWATGTVWWTGSPVLNQMAGGRSAASIALSWLHVQCAQMLTLLLPCFPVMLDCQSRPLLPRASPQVCVTLMRYENDTVSAYDLSLFSSCSLKRDGTVCFGSQKGRWALAVGVKPFSLSLEHEGCPRKWMVCFTVKFINVGTDGLKILNVSKTFMLGSLSLSHLWTFRTELLGKVPLINTLWQTIKGDDVYCPATSMEDFVYKSSALMLFLSCGWYDS